MFPMTELNENVVPSLIDKAGQGTFATLICTKLVNIFSLASINGELTALLTLVSIVYMGYKAYNERRVKRDRDKLDKK